jgi:hypothetical protein
MNNMGVFVRALPPIGDKTWHIRKDFLNLGKMRIMFIYLLSTSSNNGFYVFHMYLKSSIKKRIREGYTTKQIQNPNVI